MKENLIEPSRLDNHQPSITPIQNSSQVSIRAMTKPEMTSFNLCHFEPGLDRNFLI